MGDSIAQFCECALQFFCHGDTLGGFGDVRGVLAEVVVLAFGQAVLANIRGGLSSVIREPLGVLRGLDAIVGHLQQQHDAAVAIDGVVARERALEFVLKVWVLQRTRDPDGAERGARFVGQACDEGPEGLGGAVALQVFEQALLGCHGLTA